MSNAKQEGIHPDKMNHGSKVPNLNLASPPVSMNPNRLSPKPGRLVIMPSVPKTPTLVPLTQAVSFETPQLTLQTSPHSTSPTKPQVLFNHQTGPAQSATNPNRMPPRHPSEKSQSASSNQVSPRHHDRHNQSMSVTSINQHPTFSQHDQVVGVDVSQKHSKVADQPFSSAKLWPFSRMSPMPPISATLPTTHVPLTLQALSRCCNTPPQSAQPPKHSSSTGNSPYYHLPPTAAIQTQNPKHTSLEPKPLTTTSLSTANTKTPSNTTNTSKITPFTDPTFEPCLSSLVSKANTLNGKYPSDLRALLWVRATYLFGTEVSKVCADVRPENVGFGEFESGPVLEALACLARWPATIVRLFDVLEIREDGLHAVWLCWGGVWTQVILDDYLPVVDYKRGVSIAFGRSTQDDLWVCLIEKAFAKLSGSYLFLPALCPESILRGLTGAPYQEIDLRTSGSIPRAQESLGIAVTMGWPVFILSKRKGYPSRILGAEPVGPTEGGFKLLVSDRVYGLEELIAASACIAISQIHGAFYNNWIEATLSAAKTGLLKTHITLVFNISLGEDSYIYFTVDGRGNSQTVGIPDLPKCRLTILCQAGDPMPILCLVNCDHSRSVMKTLQSPLLSLKAGQYSAILDIYDHSPESRHTSTPAPIKVVLGTYSSSLPALSQADLPFTDITRIERRIWLNLLRRTQATSQEQQTGAKPLKHAVVAHKTPNNIADNTSLTNLLNPLNFGAVIEEKLVEVKCDTSELVVVRKCVYYAEETFLVVAAFEVVKGEFGVEFVLNSSRMEGLELLGDICEGDSVWIRALPGQPSCLLVKLEPGNSATDISIFYSPIINRNIDISIRLDFTKGRLIENDPNIVGEASFSLLKCSHPKYPDCAVPPQVHPFTLQNLLKESHKSRSNAIADMEIISPRHLPSSSHVEKSVDEPRKLGLKSDTIDDFEDLQGMAALYLDSQPNFADSKMVSKKNLSKLNQSVEESKNTFSESFMINPEDQTCKGDFGGATFVSNNLSKSTKMMIVRQPRNSGSFKAT